MIRRIVEWRRRKTAALLLPIKRALLGDQVMIGVDVGSAGGMQPHWRAYEGLVEFYCFEPHAESFKKLSADFAAHPSSKKFHVLPTGLSRNGGERTLYMLNTPTGSSLCPIDESSEFVSPNDDYILPMREARIQTRRLADVMDEVGVNLVDIIKLDVQGAELEILHGMGSSRRANLILAEVEVNICGGVSRNFSYYRGAPTWSEIDEMFSADGMRLLDISVARSYRARNGDEDWYQRNVFNVYRNSPSLSAHIWEADVVYVRDWRALVDRRDAMSLRKLAIALCGYRFFSEAAFIIERAEAADIFDSHTATGLRDCIVRWHDAGRYPWHTRGRLWKQYMWFDYPNG